MDLEFKLSTESVETAGLVTPRCVEPSARVADVLRLMQQHRSGCVLICRDQRLIGIFTERDALRLMHRGLDPDAAIEHVMVADPVTINPDTSIAAAILRMSSGGYRRLPVIDAQGQPVGVLPVSAIMHYLVEHFPQTIYNQSPVAFPVTQDREGS